MRISDWSSDVCSSDLTAIEGLTAAKDKLPDYSLTLRAMDERLDRIDERLHRIDQHPAMQLTPLTMAAQMFEASKTCRAEDRKAIGDGREALARPLGQVRSEEHTSELQSLMRISYAVFCLKKKSTITLH